jgi:hypothetical protein
LKGGKICSTRYLLYHVSPQPQQNNKFLFNIPRNRLLTTKTRRHEGF